MSIKNWSEEYIKEAKAGELAYLELDSIAGTRSFISMEKIGSCIYSIGEN